MASWQLYESVVVDTDQDERGLTSRKGTMRTKVSVISRVCFHKSSSIILRQA